jgi:beta-glucanase (GH16 family)
MKKNIIILFLTLCAGSVLGQSFLTTNYNYILSCSDEFNTSSLSKWSTLSQGYIRASIDGEIPGTDSAIFYLDNMVSSGQTSTISNSSPVCKLSIKHLSPYQKMTDTSIGKEYNVNYTAGELYNHQYFRYGYYEARVKLPGDLKGICSAFWLYGGSETTYGEIDAFENPTFSGNQNVWGTHIHAGTKNNGFAYNVDSAKSFPSIDFTAAFHTFGLEWQPDHISYFLDGILYQTYTTINHNTDPRCTTYINNANQISVSNVKDPCYLVFWIKPDNRGTDPYPNGQSFEIDWFHYYKRKPILTGVVYNSSNNTIALTVKTENDEDIFSWAAGSNIVINGITNTAGLSVATITLNPAYSGTSVTVSATGVHPVATSSSPYIFRQNPSVICGNLAQNNIYVTANLVAPTSGCTSTVVTAGTTVTFAASNSITLNAGFEVQLGAEFNALTK